MTERPRYSEPGPATRSDFDDALSGGDPLAISEALIGLVGSDPDRGWLEDLCLQLAERHEAEDVRRVAVTCLGHIARVFGEIDRAKVLPALADLERQPGLAAQILGAREDIELFA